MGSLGPYEPWPGELPPDAYGFAATDHQRAAFALAVAGLLAKADARPWIVRMFYRLTTTNSAPIDRYYIIDFARLGALSGVLGCCRSLGISKDEVTTIHTLIFR